MISFVLQPIIAKKEFQYTQNVLTELTVKKELLSLRTVHREHKELEILIIYWKS
jgi:hypothetical protein